MDRASRWRGVLNLLCVRLDSLGDVLMTTPAIRALKASAPGRRITLLTSPAGAAVAKLVPEIDKILVYEAPWMKASGPRDDSRAEYALADRLRVGRFDGAAIFTVYSQNPLPSAYLCYLADIPRRLAHCHENPYQLLTDWVPDPEPVDGVRHEVRRQLDLVASVGSTTVDERLSLRVPSAAFAGVGRLLDRVGLDVNRPWVVIHPGASAASRRYPAASFAMVARRLVEDLEYQVVLSGGESERELVRTIQELMVVPSHSLAGCLNLAELAALISLTPVLVANNSGPVHVAAAVGTPVVDVYALTNPQHTPWAVPNRVLSHDVPCKYCYRSICPEGHHNCLRLVTPEAIVEATRELMNSKQGGPKRGFARSPALRTGT
jgi:lipopolysaccharide heptosyltransferase II